MLQWHPLVTQLLEVLSAQLAIFVPVQYGKPLLKREKKRGKSNSGKEPDHLFNLYFSTLN